MLNLCDLFAKLDISHECDQTAAWDSVGNEVGYKMSNPSFQTQETATRFLPQIPLTRHPRLMGLGRVTDGYKYKASSSSIPNPHSHTHEARRIEVLIMSFHDF